MTVLLISALFVGVTVRAQTAGSFDPSFVFVPSTETSTLLALAVQADEKVIAVGSCFADDGSSGFCITRLNRDGSLDASFVGDSGNALGKVEVRITNGYDYGLSVAIQSDGRILVGGTCQAIGGEAQLCFVRLLPDGKLDRSFKGPSGNGNGTFIVAKDTNRPYRIPVVNLPLASQTNGKFLVALDFQIPFTNSFGAMRFNGDGAIDTSFATLGILALSTQLGFFIGHDLLLASDGKFLISGRCSSPASAFCVARITAEGALDQSFNSTNPINPGILSVRVLADSNISHSGARISVGPDGAIVLGGVCLTSNTSGKLCFVRVLSDGTIDTSFVGPNGDGQGKFSVPIGPDGTNAEKITGMVHQPDGKLFVASGVLIGTKSYLGMARFESDGSFDVSFGGVNVPPGDGIVVHATADLFPLRGFAFQANGKTLHVGTCQFDKRCIARIHGGAFRGRQCSLDLDGDGRVLATVDTLISTRVARGLRGLAVVNGINFPPDSKRNTWPDIRDFLNAHCGMSTF